METYFKLLEQIDAATTIKPELRASKQIGSHYANWVLPGYLMCGGYPGQDGITHFTEDEALENLRHIVEDGIDTFVCLQAELPPQCETACSTVIHPYFPKYEDYAYTLRRNQIQSITGNDFRFLHTPMIDQSTPTKAEFMKNVAIIIGMIMIEKRVVYLHCAQGHGRTGVYVAGILTVLYSQYDIEDILRFIQYTHDTRHYYQCHDVIPPLSPNTKRQVAFVKEFYQFIQWMYSSGSTESFS